jgi:hypothetical protein
VQPGGKPQERVLTVAPFLAREGPRLMEELVSAIEQWYVAALEGRAPRLRLEPMSLIALILLVALLIPIMGIVVDLADRPALARRLEGPQETPPGIAELAKKVDLLEAEVDDLTRSVQSLQDENAFLQRLLADPSSRSTLPPPDRP